LKVSFEQCHSSIETNCKHSSQGILCSVCVTEAFETFLYRAVVTSLIYIHIHSVVQNENCQNVRILQRSAMFLKVDAECCSKEQRPLRALEDMTVFSIPGTLQGNSKCVRCHS
jgi:hypothetical protein